MKKAVVFDMDGVIFDSERLYRKHWMITGKEFEIPEKEMQELCNLMAGATKEKNARLMKDHYGEDFDYDSFRETTMTRMDDEIEKEGLQLKPGVQELFSYLKEHHFKIGLATSTIKERAERNLKNAGILEVFDEIIYGGTVPKGKPEPDIYLKACEMLHVKPKDAIGIEDSYNGVKASAAAGLYTIMVVDLVPPTEELRKTANQVYDSLYDVIDLLSGTNDL